MKRNYCKLLLSIALILSSFTLCAFAQDVPKACDSQVINTVKILEIASGDENGNMNFDKQVTRAEFVKMAISASVNKDKAKNSVVSYSLFPDVKASFWGAGFISTAIDAGLVNGYLDGTFKPGGFVTLEEAATIVLRLLGYTTSDFKGTYPSSQLEKYNELELNENISAVKGQKLTREECMILIYNMLSTKTKNGAIYCTTLGYETDSEGKIDYNALLEKELEGPFILTSGKTVERLANFTLDANTVYSLNSVSSSPDSIREGDVIYYSGKINSVFAFRKTATGIITAKNGSSSVTLSGGKSYNIKTAKARSKLSLGGVYSEKNSFVTLLLGLNDEVADIIDGDKSKISDNPDNASYISMIDTVISLPIYLDGKNGLESWADLVPFDKDKAEIFVNGVSTKSYTPSLSDVIYYAKPFNSIWIYRENVSGNISALSSSSVTIGNKTYSLATNEAKIAVSTYGQFKTDDYVRLVLGKNDEVISILAANPDEIGKKDNDATYSEVVSGSLKGPYIVGEDGSMDKLTLDIASATIYKSNTSIQANEIAPYDVYYFSPVLNTVWIYRDSVSGTIEAITPLSSPTSVTLSGNTYNVETSQASYDLSSFGAFRVGDKATLLLDMNGAVAGVVSVDSVSRIYYGVVTARGEKQFTDRDGDSYTAEYVTVTDTSNKSYTYEHLNKNLGVGDIVRVTVGETVKLTEQSTSLGRNTLATVINAINAGRFADDCKIIEINGSQVAKIYPSRFDGAKLDIEAFLYSKLILYCVFDENNNLKELILNNFTGDLNEYGIVTASSSTLVTYMVDNNKRTYSVQGTGCSEGPCVIYYTDGAVSSLRTLTGYVEDVDFITKTTVYDIKGNEYPIFEDVKVFLLGSGSYKSISLEDAIAGSYSYEAYYDKAPEKGGKIRVIIATNT